MTSRETHAIILILLTPSYYLEAFYVELDSSTRVTKQPILVYTGVQNLPVRATQTEQLLVGRSWNDPSTLRFLPCIFILQYDLT